jgi:hypothetical protein
MVEAALESWFGGSGPTHFASKRRDKADRLKNEDAAERRTTTISERDERRRGYPTRSRRSLGGCTS